MVELKELSLQDDKEIYDMIKEIGPGENGFQNRGYYINAENFKDYLKGNINMSKGVDLDSRYVPQTLYWLYVDDKPVGIGKIRDYLNENLKKEGGHIGYSIRPSKRGNGYGNIMLKELIKKAKGKHIDRILVTCEDYNTPSRRIIENNKGSLQDINDHKCRYWINNL